MKENAAKLKIPGKNPCPEGGKNVIRTLKGIYRRAYERVYSRDYRVQGTYPIVVYGQRVMGTRVMGNRQKDRAHFCALSVL